MSVEEGKAMEEPMESMATGNVPLLKLFVVLK